MRIDRIQVGAFGRLRGLDTGPTSLAKLVVVLGPNEAGKSTLFTFLTTALYGFQPASRERNPHVPWGTDEASGLIRVRLDADRCAEVERTLRSQPVGRLTVEGRSIDLRNHAVPWVDHVPRAVFRQVFAITLNELAGLDGETWARIQDKVIGSMGATDLNSARAVADVLEREAGEIWRPNRRGNQRLRALQAEIRDLRVRRTGALERDATVRRLVEERERVRTELHEVREKRHLDRSELERARSLLPVRKQLQRIATLREEGGPRDVLDGLPPDPPQRFVQLRAQSRAMQEELETSAREIQEREAIIAGSVAAGTLLARRDEIARLVARAAGYAPERVRTVELEGEIADVEARLDVSSSRALKTPWSDLPQDELTGIPVELIRERIGRASTSAPGPDEAEPSRQGLTWAALAAGGTLLAWGLYAGQVILTSAGAAAVASALTLWLKRARPSPATPRPDTAGLRDVRTLLDRLLVRDEHLARPDEALVSELTNIRDLARARSELLRALEGARQRVVAVDAEARELAHSLGRHDPADAEALARDLDRDLRSAERLQEAAAAAGREVRRLRLDQAASTETQRKVLAELAALTESAEAMLPGDPHRGLRVALARIEAHERADRLDEELRRSHPGLDDLLVQIEDLDRAEHAWSVDEEALARAAARIEVHDEQIEDLLRRGEALEGEASHLRDLETVDAVDSEITALREEEARLARERDRKWVLARVLREADRRFRQEHQPDLLRRAGSYLEHLTGGRYERLIVDETDGNHLFHLVGPTLPTPVPLAPPISTGTLEQAYLSLRLAIVDHLDQGGERLPLFIDEIFVNWDGERRARGLEVLAGIASTRQVFVFTCHPRVAAELSERGGHVLELDGSE